MSDARPDDMPHFVLGVTAPLTDREIEQFRDAFAASLQSTRARFPPTVAPVP